MVRRSNNNSIFILVGLLVIVAIIAWTSTKDSNESMKHLPQNQSTISVYNGEEGDDYDMIYGNPQDFFGMGAGASHETTNEWTLLG